MGNSARCMRMLLHGAMCCGVIANLAQLKRTKLENEPGELEAAQREDDKEVTRVYDHIANKETTTQLHTQSEASFLVNHFLNDWTLLAEGFSSHSEDLSVGLHALLFSMMDVKQDSARRHEERNRHRWNQLGKATQLFENDE